MLLMATNLITKAITVGSIGQVSVAKFGREFELLVPFSSQISDEAGANLIKSINLNQSSSNVNKGLSSAVDYLLSTRTAKSSSDSQSNELVFVISDGKNLNSVKLNESLVKAHQEKIIVLLIIIDAAVQSIESVVVPRFSPTTSELLCLQPYMETLPFDFYIILKDVKNLPRVLSSTIHEWVDLFHKGNQ